VLQVPKGYIYNIYKYNSKYIFDFMRKKSISYKLYRLSCMSLVAKEPLANNN